MQKALCGTSAADSAPVGFPIAPRFETLLAASRRASRSNDLPARALETLRRYVAASLLMPHSIYPRILGDWPLFADIGYAQASGYTVRIAGRPVVAKRDDGAAGPGAERCRRARRYAAADRKYRSVAPKRNHSIRASPAASSTTPRGERLVLPGKPHFPERIEDLHAKREAHERTADDDDVREHGLVLGDPP